MKKLQGKVSIKKIGEKITVVASDETLDRHGEVLKIENWNLSRFKAAPRMLVDHDHRVEKIVGKWNNVRIEGKELLMEPEFHGFTDLAKAVEEMVNEGFLDTVSVGFIPHGPEKDGDHESFELIETSWVTVPANSNARVIQAFKDLEGKQVSDDAKKQIEKFSGEEMIIKTVEDVPKEIVEGEVVRCEAQFILKLVEENKKQQTLIDTHDEELKEVVASVKDRSHKMLQIALKEVAKTVNDALRHANAK